MENIDEKVKQALLTQNAKIELRITLPNSKSGFVTSIGPDELVKDSFQMTSRLCTKDELKFGLCEGSNIEFQCFDVPADAILDVGGECYAYVIIYIDGVSKERIYLGRYSIDSVIKKQSNGIYKINAVDVLGNGLLDVDFKTILNLDEPYMTLKEHYLFALFKYMRSIGIEIYGDANNYGTTNSSQSVAVRNLALQNGNYLNIYYYVITRTIPSNIYSDDRYYQATAFIKRVFNKFIALCDCHDEVLEDGTTFYETACAGINWIASGCIAMAAESGASDPTVIQIYNNADDYVYSDYYTQKNSPTSGAYYQWLPMYVVSSATQATSVSSAIETSVKSIGSTFISEMGTYPDISINYIECDNDLEYEFDYTEDDLDLTPREYLSAFLEKRCQFGELNRRLKRIEFRSLDSEGLYPSETLYPDNYLYPDGGAESANKRKYKTLYMAPEIKKYRNIVITYLQASSEGDYKETYTYEVNADGNVDYNMDDNWILLNDAASSSTIAEIAKKMSTKMKSMRWVPFEMESVNLCYLEVGDMVELQDNDGNAYVSYVLEQDISGVHTLEDTFYNGTVETF